MISFPHTLGLFFRMAFLFLSFSQASSARKPNILWVVTDDQRWDSISAFNVMVNQRKESALGKVISPNVDRLAKMGTTFLNTFNQNPSCAPSRASMHTGRYSHRTGIYGYEFFNPKGMAHWRPLVSEIMRDVAGYQTITVGKRGIRYVEDAKRNKSTNLFDVDLGYRRQFASEGLIDWMDQLNRKTREKTENFYFSGGKTIVWTDNPKDILLVRTKLARRLDLFRDYRPKKSSSKGMAEGDILGGVNPNSTEFTRDGAFSTELLNYFKHGGKDFETSNGRRVPGPAKDKPVFIHCGFDFPHTPILPPAKFRKMFEGITYKIPKFEMKELISFSPQIRQLFRTAGSDHYTDSQKQQMISDYFAFCAYGDALVGKTVDGFVKFSEERKEPWLVLYVCGDHGWKLNEHGLIKKFGPYDIDLHNPIIAVSSDKEAFPEDKVVRDFTTFVDMAPTFLSAAGIDLAKQEYDYLDGRDLAVVASGKDRPRDYIIAEPTVIVGPCAVIRTKDYKFMMKVLEGGRNQKGATWAAKQKLKDVEPLFFDLRIDPGETHNLAAKEHYRPVINLMRKKLQNIVLGDGRADVDWIREGGGKVVISNFAPGADDGKLTLPKISPMKMSTIRR